MDIKALILDHNLGTVLECIICTIVTCEFHLFVQGLQRTFKSHVNSIITFACCLYMYMPFNYL